MTDINDIKAENQTMGQAVAFLIEAKQLHGKIVEYLSTCVEPQTMQETDKPIDFAGCLGLIDCAQTALDNADSNIENMDWGKQRWNLRREYRRLCKTNNILTQKINKCIINQQRAKLNGTKGIDIVSTLFGAHVDLEQFAHVAEQNAIAATAREKEAEHRAKVAEANGAEKEAIAAKFREQEAAHKAQEAEALKNAKELEAQIAAEQTKKAEHAAKEAEALIKVKELEAQKAEQEAQKAEQEAQKAEQEAQKAAKEAEAFQKAKEAEERIIAEQSNIENLKLAERIRSKDAQIVGDARAAIETASRALSDAIAARDAQQIAEQSEIIKQESGRIKDFAGAAPTPEITNKHKQFDGIFKDIKQNIAPMLVGPAGSGKSTVLQQCADALHLQYYPLSVNGQTSEYQIVGYKSANGDYVRSAFRDAFEHGGLFSFEEIDAGNPNVLTVMNNALSQDFYLFPDGVVKKHPFFRLAASANTYGRGATRQYIGRNAIDAATLDRFAMTYVYYDEGLEWKIGPDKKWTQYVQTIRHVVESFKMPIIVSTRAVVFGGRDVQSGTPWDVALNKFIWRGCNQSDIDKIMVNVQRQR